MCGADSVFPRPRQRCWPNRFGDSKKKRVDVRDPENGCEVLIRKLYAVHTVWSPRVVYLYICDQNPDRAIGGFRPFLRQTFKRHTLHQPLDRFLVKPRRAICWAARAPDGYINNLESGRLLHTARSPRVMRFCPQAHRIFKCASSRF